MRTALTSSRLERTLTELDHVRLTRLLQRQPSRTRAVIGELLTSRRWCLRARSAHVVTMASQVLLHDAATGTPGKIIAASTRPMPARSRLRLGALAGGRYLLGLRCGELARWTTPDGRTHAARIEGAAVPARGERRSHAVIVQHPQDLAPVGFQLLRADATLMPASAASEPGWLRAISASVASWKTT